MTTVVVLGPKGLITSLMPSLCHKHLLCRQFYKTILYSTYPTTNLLFFVKDTAGNSSELSLALLLTYIHINIACYELFSRMINTLHISFIYFCCYWIQIQTQKYTLCLKQVCYSYIYSCLYAQTIYLLQLHISSFE